MKFSGRCVCMAGLCIAIMSPAGAQGIEDATVAVDTTALCDPLKDKLVATNASECIDEFFKHYSEESDGDKLSASYALGVRFQREIAGQFKDFNYAGFLLGALEQADKTMQFSDTQLNSVLESILLSKAEQSDKFVRAFAARPEVEDWKGIYYIDRSEKLALKDPGDGVCNQPAEFDSAHDYVVEYVRLDFGVDVISEIGDYTCLQVNDDEVIRGWRTALRKMKEGDDWELLVPAPLAYGDNGMASTKQSASVEKGEALRFLIRLRKKS